MHTYHGFQASLQESFVRIAESQKGDLRCMSQGHLVPFTHVPVDTI